MYSNFSNAFEPYEDRLDMTPEPEEPPKAPKSPDTPTPTPWGRALSYRTILPNDPYFQPDHPKKIAMLCSGKLQTMHDKPGLVDMTTTTFEGMCLGNNTAGDLIITNGDHPRRIPHFIHHDFFRHTSRQQIHTFLIGKRIRFSYGVMVPNLYKIEIIK